MNKSSKLSLAWLALVAALTLTYANHFDNAFQFDDVHTIVENLFIRDIGNVPRIFQDAQAESSLPTNQSYRPMVTTLNTIDYWLAGGLEPFYFHLHIFLEYVVLLILLYFILIRIFRMASGDNHEWVALLGTAFYAFHTANAETINYIIARSDEFSTLMTLAGALIFISANGWKKQLGLIPFVIGCLAKPTTLMLAPIVFVYQLLLEKPSLLVADEQPDFIRKVRSAVIITLPYFAVGAVMYLFTRLMYSDTWTPSNSSVVHYLQTQPYVLWIYIKTFFLPTQLTVDTDLSLIKNLADPRVILGLAVIGFSLYITYVCAKRRLTLPVSFGILWFFIALIPSSSVVPLAEVMNHHRTFFPYIGLMISVVWGIFLLFELLRQKLSSRSLVQGAFLSISVVVVAAHAWGTYQRNETWHSNESLWLDATEKSPNNGRGLMNYGLTQMRKGEIDTAIKYFEKARETGYGTHPYLYINLGVAYDALGRTDQAESYFKLAVQKGPGYPDTHYYYGRWLLEKGDKAQAIRKLKRALELSPAHNKVKFLLDKADNVPLKELLEQAKARAADNPTPENYLELSLQYYNNQLFEESVDAANQALQARPDYAAAYNNVCAARNELGRWDEAIDACNRALTLKPNHELARGNLNWALYKKNKANRSP